MKNNNSFDPDNVYQEVLKFCTNNDEKKYAYDHKARFSFMLSKIIPLVKPSMNIASIGLSIFDPVMNQILKESHTSYYILVPNIVYADKFESSLIDNLNLINYDVCSPHPPFEKMESRFDMILFYETLEHLLYPDELVLKNITKIINVSGVLLGSVPNALSIGRRISVLSGKNTYWPKKDIVNGVFYGYGHIREYAIYEMKELLSEEFENIKIYGYSPYGSKTKINILNTLPNSLRSTIFFEGVKKVTSWK
jgi:hypothetical protein